MMTTETTIDQRPKDKDVINSCIIFLQNLGLMMEYILAKEHKDRQKIISDIQSETTRKELKICDEDEDFLDEGINVFTSLSVFRGILLLEIEWILYLHVNVYHLPVNAVSYIIS